MSTFIVLHHLNVKKQKNENLSAQIQNAIHLIEKNNSTDFLALESLNEVIAQLPKTRIGDEMRSTFKLIFSEFLKYDYLDEITSMEAFWRS